MRSFDTTYRMLFIGAAPEGVHQEQGEVRMAAMRLPKTAEEMQAMVFGAVTLRAYLEITTAARRGRLTEHDIAVIERNCVADMHGEADFAHEFSTFEAEPAVARARADAKAFFAATKSARQGNLEK